MFKKNIVLFLKSIVIGMFMLVPGISGGTLAIIFNIYDELLSKVSHLFNDFKTNFIYLFIAFLGGCIGLFSSSFMIGFLLSSFQFELIFTFIGIMFLYILKVVINSKLKVYIKWGYILIGIAIGYLISLIPIGCFTGDENILLLLFLGVFLSVALVLPGVSVSYVLLIFGLYENLILAISEFRILYLLKIGFFLLLGLIIVVKGLNYILQKKKKMMDLIISGFIISSILTVIPTLDNTHEIIYALIFFVIGILINSLFNLKN